MTKAKSPKVPDRLLINYGEGKADSMGGIGVVFKVFGKDTNGAFSIIEHPIQPRTLVPPHLHEETDEFSIVVEGRIGARIGNQVIDAAPGSYVLKPRGIPHTFWNPENKPARIIEIISPPGFEQFFDETAKLLQEGPRDVQKVAEIARRYHTTFGWDEWVPELSAKYKLSLFGG